MNKKILLLFVALISYALCHGSELDSLLTQLDITINNKEQYSKAKDDKIKKLKMRFRYAAYAEEKMSLANNIVLEYIVYRTDSALHYALEMDRIASRALNQERAAEAKIHRARIMRTMGLYKEASDLLDSLKSNLPQSKLSDYLGTRLSIENALREFTSTKEMKEFYTRRAAVYRDSILALTNINPMAKLFIVAEDLITRGEYDQGLAIMKENYVKLDPLERDAGVIAYSIAIMFRSKGDMDKEMEYFARSAIADLHAGVKDYTSLRSLAELMYRKGNDIDRAYNYMKCSLEDALFCKARLMTIEASDMFMVIDQSYQLKEKQRKDMVFKFLIITIFMSLLLLAMVIVAWTQNKKLERTKENLSRLNEALNEANQSLLDSNRIKEEYIGLYMEQYSSHLSKYISIKNKTKNYAKGGGDIKGLISIIDSYINEEKEIKEFYSNFDATILNLFPDFPKQFDKLLVPEARGIYTNTKDGLSPVLRVFALVRLGISDSMKIAPFLRYSTTTIYNYKTKIRNLAICPRDEFEQMVMRIYSSTSSDDKSQKS